MYLPVHLLINICNRETSLCNMYVCRYMYNNRYVRIMTLYTYTFKYVYTVVPVNLDYKKLIWNLACC